MCKLACVLALGGELPRAHAALEGAGGVAKDPRETLGDIRDELDFVALRPSAWFQQHVGATAASQSTDALLSLNGSLNDN